MRSRKYLSYMLIILCLTAALGQAAAVYKFGSRGNGVLLLQEKLLDLDYFKASPTGYYGKLTVAAVTDFQKQYKLNPDGIAGEQTLSVIDQILARGKLTSRSGGHGTVAALAWDVVNPLWPVGTTAHVYDIDTGLYFTAWREFGTLHADVEPLTKQDTEIMRRIYSGSWSWSRRAIIVELGGRYIAASMNGMPHGQEKILDNDFHGQFCIHFLDSRLHKNHKSDPGHQSMVLRAARAGLAGLARPAQEPTIEESPALGEELQTAPENQENIE